MFKLSPAVAKSLTVTLSCVTVNVMPSDLSPTVYAVPSIVKASPALPVIVAEEPSAERLMLMSASEVTTNFLLARLPSPRVIV